MKSSIKQIIILNFCFFFLAAFCLLQIAWTAPKGTIVISQAGDPTTFDPHMHAESYGFVVQRQVYDLLVNRVMKDGKLQHVPMLATSWQAINDTTWVFNLRKGVKFHNGEDFDAEAVKYSIERVLNPAQKARMRGIYTFIDRVEIVDPYKVRIITKGPAPTLIVNLGYAMFIVPPKYFKEKGDEYVARNPVGTGPFKFVRWKKDDEIVLEANETYWAGPPKLKTVIFKPIPEDATRVSALLGGSVDIIVGVPTHLFPMVNQSKVAKIMSVPSPRATHVHMDTLKPGPLQDKRVRQAINYAVDKEAIIKNVLEGYGQVMATPISPFHFGFDPNIKPYPYDPQKAKSLLKEAGYGSGLNLTFNSPSGRYVKAKEFAEAIVGQLSEVGINVKLEVFEWGSYMKKVYSPEGAGPMYTLGWTSTLDADGVLYSLLACDQLPLSRWCNKQFHSLLEQARSTIDQKKREQIYSQALKIVHEEAPWLFLHIAIDAYGVSNRVKNWKPTSDDNATIYMYGTSVED
jgi:peptide/nickel transport system substrate-binding protein